MSRPKKKPAEFFVDRSLGKSIVEGLRATGLTVHSMADIYGERRAQLLADEVWLRDAGKNDWIVLTKDDAIRRRPAERDALTEAAERFIAKRRPSKRRSDQSENALVPIETSNSEEYEITRPESGKRAVRREAKLVRDYAAILEAGGDEVVRNKLLPAGSPHALYSDVYNLTRKQLVEAKAGTGRGDVRMAIGQLADYGRFVPKGADRAVLLDAKPQADLLVLLDSQGIAAIWRNGECFVDNAGGRFV